MAVNFLHLSPKFVEIQSLGRSKSSKRLEKLEAIIALMGDDYDIEMPPKKVLEILEAQDLAMTESDFYRQVRLVRSLVDFFRLGTSEQEEVKVGLIRKDQKGKQDRRSLEISIQAFEADGITSWEKIQELLHPAPEADKESTRKKDEPLYVPKFEEGEIEESVDQIESEVAKAETQIREGVAIFSRLLQARQGEASDLRRELAECFDAIKELEAAKYQAKAAFEDKAEILRQLGIADFNLKAAHEAILQKDAQIIELTREREDLKSQLLEKTRLLEDSDKKIQELQIYQSLGETVGNFMAQINPQAPQAQVPVGGSIPAEVTCKSVRTPEDLSLPIYSEHYKRKIEYGQETLEYFLSLKKKSQRLIRNKLVIFSKVGCKFSSFNPKEIEGGEYDGKKQLTVGKFRVHFEERSSLIFINNISRKGTNKHIKE